MNAMHVSLGEPVGVKLLGILLGHFASKREQIVRGKNECSQLCGLAWKVWAAFGKAAVLGSHRALDIEKEKTKLRIVSPVLQCVCQRWPTIFYF